LERSFAAAGRGNQLLQKEDIVPDAANKPLFNLAPYVMFTGAFGALLQFRLHSIFVPAH